MKGNNGSKAQLFQLWTTVRFRIFLKAAAEAQGTSMSAYAREAAWMRIQNTLDEKTKQRLERRATAEETKKP